MTSIAEKPYIKQRKPLQIRQLNLNYAYSPRAAPRPLQGPRQPAIHQIVITPT